jgi:uncharacterized membrane protein
MSLPLTEGSDPGTEEIGTGRLEAFSDGVFAIAVTLLVLDIRVPGLEQTDGGAHLLDALVDLWPSYLGYVTSFATILIMWMNHHLIFRAFRRTDHGLLLLNGLLLMCITFVPFPTSLLAEYIEHEGQTVAAAVYAGTFTITAVVFNAVWRHAAHRGRLLRTSVQPALVRTISRQYLLGPLLYLFAFLLAFISVTASVAVCALLAVVFALPIAWLRR